MTLRWGRFQLPAPEPGAQGPGMRLPWGWGGASSHGHPEPTTQLGTVAGPPCCSLPWAGEQAQCTSLGRSPAAQRTPADSGTPCFLSFK